MNEYIKQAKDFLKDCNATMKIFYLVTEINKDWDDKQKRDHYIVHICTPKGVMQVNYWDSVHNTRTNQERKLSGLPIKKPTEYDILACLQKYEVGTMEDFFSDFGYEIKCVKNITNFINTYNAVVKEYQDICCCFTPEQIEKMREIQ